MAHSDTNSDPVRLLRELIRCRSVTPHDGGALDTLASRLESIGFRCTRLPFEEPGTDRVDNLFARFGTGSPHFCFAGHSDVVPPGNETAWSYPPFAAEIADGRLYGRGAADMKGSLAAFVSATGRYLERCGDSFAGSISLLITGDEEGPAINGTRKVLEWLHERNALPGYCLVGEPTSVLQLGDTVKIGRRGSLNVAIRVVGRQGHSAYPQNADNPVTKLVRLLDRLASEELDEGNADFEPSTLAITTVDVGNPAVNVIPESARAHVNIRFNTEHDATSLERWVRTRCAAVERELGGRFDLAFSSNAQAFLTARDGPFVDVVSTALTEATGIVPALSTSGGTSDARFIKDYCPVVEFGPINASIHQTDEHITLAELNALADAYLTILQRFFSTIRP